MQMRFRKRGKLKKADYSESREPLGNPGCGWYHVYSFEVEAGQDPAASVVSATAGEAGSLPVASEVRDMADEVRGYLSAVSEGEQLALVRMNIGAFRDKELSAGALLYIEKILGVFRENGKQMILRIAYDTEGKGLAREPLILNLVKRHIEQLGVLIERYAEDILVVQGILVGNWGEMHGSKFLSAYSMTELMNTLYLSTKGKCYLAVRTPAQWRKIVSCRIVEAGVRERLALFNDGIFGSETDLGTYGAAGRQEAGETESWKREEELVWQSRHMESVPCGGEAVAAKEPVGYIQAAKEMRKMHLSYLNSVYQKEQLEYWKTEEADWLKGVKSGRKSGYDYIGLHLGYRFVVRNVRSVFGGGLQIEIENCGFAGLYEEAECFLLIGEAGQAVRRERIDTDARQWRSGETTVIRTVFPQKGETTEACSVYLQLKRKRDGRTLRFANQNVYDMVLLGRFTGKSLT